MTRRPIFILLSCLLLILCSCATTGASPNRLYFEAEACYKKLQNQPENHKYRSYWFKCIRKFESVYGADPDGPWAAAGMYMAGKLYKELYKHSYKASDLHHSRVLFEKIAADYPSSRYRQKADSELAAINGRSSDAVLTEKAKQLYFEAEAAYKKLQGSAKKKKYRVYWFDCIERFESVHKTDPGGPWAAAGMYMAGRLYSELYEHSYKPADRRAAEDIFNKVISAYPSSVY